MTESRPDRAALGAELERARADFQRLLAAAESKWDKPTLGTRWTNEQLHYDHHRRQLTVTESPNEWSS